jgi:HTH-type transcriptional regulator / antitoxin HigA
MTKAYLSLPAEPPKTYEELVRLYPPRKIRDKVEHGNATEVADWLATRARNEAQLDYLELLGDLLDKYEHTAKSVPEAEPLELLKHLVEENKITTRALGQILGVDHSAAARILKGERSITPEHAKRLGARFKLRPSVFLGVD